MVRSSRRLRLLCVLILLVLSAGTRRIQGFDDSVTVNDSRDLTDPSPNVGDCSSTANTCTVRAAIVRANHRTGTHTIHLPPGNFFLTRAGQNEDDAEVGDLDIKGNIIIIGAGAKSTTIFGNNLDRVFDVHNGALFLQDLTVRGGVTPSGERGAGIRASAPVSLNRVHLTFNKALGTGGGIFTDTDLSIVRSTLSSNTATAGSALFASRDGVINADISIRESTFSGNTSGNSSAPALTFSGQFDVVVSHATIAKNTGVGIRTIGSVGGEGTIEIRDTILADHSVANCDLDEFVVTSFNNVDSDGSCGFATTDENLILVNPSLGPLADNGGQTPTHLLGNSQLIDHTNVCSGVDQRGLPRPVDFPGVLGGGCDIGAIELQGPIGIAVLDPESASVRKNQEFQLTYLWRVPPNQVWRQLESLDLRIVEPGKGKKDKEVTFWLRWHEVPGDGSDTFELVDPATGSPYGPAYVVGSNHFLETDAVRLAVGRSSRVGSGLTGKEVTLHLALTFLEKSKKDEPLAIEVTAADDFGETQPFLALGSVTVDPRQGPK